MRGAPRLRGIALSSVQLPLGSCSVQWSGLDNTLLEVFCVRRMHDGLAQQTGEAHETGPIEIKKKTYVCFENIFVARRFVRYGLCTYENSGPQGPGEKVPYVRVLHPELPVTAGEARNGDPNIRRTEAETDAN